MLNFTENRMSISKGRRTRKRTSRNRPSTFLIHVTYPSGTTSIQGYLKASRYFGKRTLLDPTCEGMDDCRLLIHNEAKVLWQTAKKLLEHACSVSCEEDSE